MDITLYFDKIIDVFFKNSISELIEDEFIYHLLSQKDHIILNGSRLYDDDDDNNYSFDDILDVFDEIIRLSDKDTVDYFIYIAEKVEKCKDIINLNRFMNNISV